MTSGDSVFPHQKRPIGDRLITAGLLIFIVAYISAFWGYGAQLLPAPLDGWYDLSYRGVADWWHAKLDGVLRPVDAAALYRALEAYLLGLFVPIVGLWACRRRLSDAGLRAPRPGTIKHATVCLLPFLPLGFLLGAVVENPWQSAIFESLELAAMLPEHFLIFGVVIGLMLPGRRLPSDESPAARPGDRPPVGGRFRLSRLSDRDVFAIAAAGLVFQMVHIGASALEVFVAFPAGIVFAYTTFTTGSIWPALICHWLLNLIPLTWLGLQSSLA